MKSFVLLTTLFFLSSGWSQESKLKGFFGKEFKQLDANQPYTDQKKNPGVIIIPGFSLEKDTSGLVYNNEYILFRQEIPVNDSFPNTNFRFIHLEPTSIAEYLEFQQWIIDSNMRARIYFTSESDEESTKMLLVNKNTIEQVEKNERINRPQYSFSIHDHQFNYQHFYMNWKYPLVTDSKENLPVLADMYIPIPERFYEKKIIDERKLVYKTPGQYAYMSTITYPYSWASGSLTLRDERSVLSQTYNDLFQDKPILVFSGSQALAFCKWKEVQLQKSLNEKGINSTVRVSLPNFNDLNYSFPAQALTVPERNYTQHWKITVDEYQKFVKYVDDSLLLEFIYDRIESDEDAALLLDHPNNYFSEISLEFEDFNDLRRHVNRSLFPLKFDKRIVSKNQDLLVKMKAFQDEYFYKYYWIDVRSRSKIGELEAACCNSENLNQNYLELKPDSSGNMPREGMDLNLGYYAGKIGNHLSGRSHENFSNFFVEELVDIHPEIPLNQNKKEFAQGISYEQALAFYNWKYPIWKAKSGDNWQDYVFPTKEQFEAVQRGEAVIVPEHQLSFPVPTFHYVVHVTLLK